MALNPESILSEYQALQSKAKAAQQTFGEQAQPDTFQSQLQSAMLNREIYPEVARLERNAMKELFTSPSEIRARLGGAVSPLQTEQLVGNRQANIMDLLGGYSDVRKGKRDELKDIIASTALGYKAKYEKEKYNLEILEDEMNQKYDEYREAIRQREHAETLSQSTAYKKEVQNNLTEEYAEYMKSRAKEEGDSWDGMMGADKWIEMRNKAVAKMGTEGSIWWEENYPLYKEVSDIASDPNSKEYNELKGAGYDYNESLNKASDKVKLDFLKDSLSKTFTEEDFISLYNDWAPYVPELTRGDDNDAIKAFKDYIRANSMVPGSSIQDPEALIEKMFPLEG